MEIHQCFAGSPYALLSKNVYASVLVWCGVKWDSGKLEGSHLSLN